MPERFWEKVDTSGDCWEWLGSIATPGYGTFVFEGRNQQAHRASWQIAFGPIPEGFHVCHRCDNKVCVRPDHLFLGSRSDNMTDCSAKGRIRQAKLNAADVRAIRLADVEGVNKAELSRRYGVNRSAIQQVIKRRTYAWVA